MKKLFTIIALLMFGLILFFGIIAGVYSISTPARADGVDEAFHKQGGTWVITPHDVNYWKDFDKHPCKYNLGYNERECIEKPDRYSWNKPENRHKKPAVSVPEPELLGLLGIGISAFAAFKTWRR